MYLPPAFSIAAFIAASSRFQRSSWKFDHETPTVWAAATRAAARTPTVTSNSVQLRDIVMRASSGQSVVAIVESRHRLWASLAERVKCRDRELPGETRCHESDGGFSARPDSRSRRCCQHGAAAG